MQATGGAYPVDFTFDAPEKVANWRPLVQWILAIPHLVMLSALRTISQILSLVSWFVIVFTGELPDAFANFQAMYLRYYVRVGSYSGFLREEYPAFAFDMVT